MGCCGKNPRARVELPPQAVPGESVLVRYSGNRGGTFSVPGRATGTSYTFNNRSQVVQVVDTKDAEYIVAMPRFELA